MKPEELVPSLEVCQKLKEAGFPQDTCWSWWPVREPELWLTELLEIQATMLIAAPTLAEALRQITTDDFDNTLSYHHNLLFVVLSKNPAEAAALLWLSIKEVPA